MSDVESSHYGEKSMLLEIFILCFILLVLSDLNILEGKSLVSCRKLCPLFSMHVWFMRILNMLNIFILNILTFLEE